MQGASAQALLFVLGFAAAATAFIALVFGANALLSPRAPSLAKNLPYECGMDQAGRPWSSQRLRFSTVAMIFVIFDAMTVMLFAVSGNLRGNPPAIAAAGVFSALLFFGLLFAWKKGALDWLS
jgi:NADH:ubiquinone oxidoreductase subunit 3 (subunit A)